MNTPKNFKNRVHNKELKINGLDFYLEHCQQNPGSVWLFGTQTTTIKGNALYFIFDWKNQTYSIRKCILGDGDDGTDIAKGCIFDKRDVQSLQRFVTMIAQHTTKILRII